MNHIWKPCNPKFIDGRDRDYVLSCRQENGVSLFSWENNGFWHWNAEDFSGKILVFSGFGERLRGDTMMHAETWFFNEGRRIKETA